MSNQEQKRTLVRRTREMLDGFLEHPTHKAVIDAVSLNQLKDGSWHQMIESFFTNLVFMNEIQP